MYMKNGILILLFASVSETLSAQQTSFADNLNNDGKINTVIVVASIILLGIFGFLFYIERKIKKLEQDL